MRVWRALRWIGISLTAAILLFLLSAWLGALIPRNSDWSEPDPLLEPTVAIMVGTNGVHTEIVMPNQTDIIDWLDLFPIADIEAPYRDYTHVSVSFGERAFFLETETWADLNPVIAARALAGGDGILHVAHYVRPAPSESYRVVNLRKSEYRALAETIAGQLVTDHRATIEPGYSRHDVFYDAHGTYSVFRTCNQWTSDQLAAAGIKTGLWTPMSGGVMQWVEAADPN
ncbi:MAG: DUF2459 domain-containing protein [Pseudomonadota bacterium]